MWIKNVVKNLLYAIFLFIGCQALADDQPHLPKQNKIFANIEIHYKGLLDEKNEIEIVSVGYPYPQENNYLDIKSLYTQDECRDEAASNLDDIYRLIKGFMVDTRGFYQKTDDYEKIENIFGDNTFVGHKESSGVYSIVRSICLPYHVIEDIDFNKWRNRDMTPEFNKPYHTPDVQQKFSQNLTYSLDEFFRRLDIYGIRPKFKAAKETTKLNEKNDRKKTMFIFPLDQEN